MNNKKYRNSDFVTYMQRNYLHGRLLDDDDWIRLHDMATTVDSVMKKRDYIKGLTTIKRFLASDLEDFQVMSDSYSTMYKTILNIEDYLKGDLSEEDMTKALKEVHEDLEKIKEDNEEYFSSKF